MFIGSRRALRKPVVISSGTSAEAQQYLDRATGMDTAHNNAAIALIDGLVADGLWSKLDAIYTLATDTKAHAKENLRSSSYTLGEVDTVAFTVDEGCVSSGTSYFTTGFIPSSAGGQFSRNSASFGGYSRTDQTGNADIVMLGAQGATAYALLSSKNAGGPVQALNDLGWLVGSVTNGQGMTIGTRTSSVDVAIYKNGNVTPNISDGASSSLGIPEFEFYVIACNVSGTAGKHNSTLQTAVVFWGSGMTATQTSNMAGRINTYMTALGKNVY